MNFINACKEGNLELVLDLISEWNIDYKWCDNNTPLMYAIKGGHTRIALTLLSKGARPNWENDHGDTALGLACWFNYTEVAQALISNGADLDYSSEICKDTHLINASKRGRIEIVQILISNGADLDSRNIFHKTAFDMALNDKVRDVFRAWKRTPRSLKFTMLQTKLPIFTFNFPKPLLTYKSFESETRAF